MCATLSFLFLPSAGLFSTEKVHSSSRYVQCVSRPERIFYMCYCVIAGPTPVTVVDFWRMIWQERVPAIVMITNLVEGKKTKCEQYWPLSGSLGFGPFKVTIINQLILADYTINTLSVEVSEKKLCICNIFMVIDTRNICCWSV